MDTDTSAKILYTKHRLLELSPVSTLGTCQVVTNLPPDRSGEKWKQFVGAVHVVDIGDTVHQVSITVPMIRVTTPSYATEPAMLTMTEHCGELWQVIAPLDAVAAMTHVLNPSVVVALNPLTHTDAYRMGDCRVRQKLNLKGMNWDSEMGRYLSDEQVERLKNAGFIPEGATCITWTAEMQTIVEEGF